MGVWMRASVIEDTSQSPLAIIAIIVIILLIITAYSMSTITIMAIVVFDMCSTKLRLTDASSGICPVAWRVVDS